MQRKKTKHNTKYIKGENFFKSKRWANLKRKVFEKYGYVCMKFGAMHCELHIDHIKSRKLRPDPTEPEPTEWQPKFGEVVEVSADESDTEVYWCKSMYLFTEYGKHHCVHGSDIDNFKKGAPYTVSTWRHVRPVQTPTITRAEAEAKMNVKIVD